MPKRKQFKLTPQFAAYKKKTLGFVGDQDPRALLRTGVGKIERAVRSIARARHGRRPAPGKWSVQEIVNHLVDTEIIFAWRVRRGLAEPGKHIEAMDQEVWARALPYRKLPVGEQIAFLKALRRNNVSFLKRIPPRLEEKGWVAHPERGKETTATQLRMWAGHDLNHLSQIQGIGKRFRKDARRRRESGARGKAR